MAVVGKADVIIRAITVGADKSIKDFGDRIKAQNDSIQRDSASRNKDIEKETEKYLARQNARYAAYGAKTDKLFKREYTRSFSTNIQTAFNKGFNARENEIGLYKFERALGVVSSALTRIKSPAEDAANNFMRLQKMGYTFQTAAGTIAGSVGSLVGGVLSLAGVFAQAAGAVGGTGAAFISVGSGIAGAKIALNGVGAAVKDLWNGQNAYNRSLLEARQAFVNLKYAAEDAALSEVDASLNLEKARIALARVQNLPMNNMVRREAELAYQRADLNLRQSKTKIKQVQDQIKLGPTVVKNPYATLAKSQQQFVRYLLSLKPVISGMVESISHAFLTPVESGIKILVSKSLPTLQSGLTQVGGAMGLAFKDFASYFSTPDNQKVLSQFFSNAVPIIREFGKAVGPAFGGLLKLLVTAQPLALQMSKWINKIAVNFNAWISNTANNKRMQEFFQKSGDVIKQLGSTVWTVFQSIGNIVNAAFPKNGKGGAGQAMLDWIKSIADGFKRFTSDPKFSKWLMDSTTNMIAMAKSLGSFAKIFIDLAAAPSLKSFWTTIQGASPYIEKILADGERVGPILAQVFVGFTKIMSELSDSGALDSFLKTLNSVVQFFADFFKNPAVQGFLNILGSIHGYVLGASVVFGILVTTTKIALGYFQKMFRTLGGVAVALQSGSSGFKTFRDYMRTANGETAKLGTGLAKATDRVINLRTALKLGGAARAATKASLIGATESEIIALEVALSRSTAKAISASEIWKKTIVDVANKSRAAASSETGFFKKISSSAGTAYKSMTNFANEYRLSVLKAKRDEIQAHMDAVKAMGRSEISLERQTALLETYRRQMASVYSTADKLAMKMDMQSSGVAAGGKTGFFSRTAGKVRNAVSGIMPGNNRAMQIAGGIGLLGTAATDVVNGIQGQQQTGLGVASNIAGAIGSAAMFAGPEAIPVAVGAAAVSGILGIIDNMTKEQAAKQKQITLNADLVNLTNKNIGKTEADRLISTGKYSPQQAAVLASKTQTSLAALATRSGVDAKTLGDIRNQLIQSGKFSPDQMVGAGKGTFARALAAASTAAGTSKLLSPKTKLDASYFAGSVLNVLGNGDKGAIGRLRTYASQQATGGVTYDKTGKATYESSASVKAFNEMMSKAIASLQKTGTDATDTTGVSSKRSSVVPRLLNDQNALGSRTKPITATLVPTRAELNSYASQADNALHSKAAADALNSLVKDGVKLHKDAKTGKPLQFIPTGKVTKEEAAWLQQINTMMKQANITG
jgi:hypothetical protein